MTGIDSYGIPIEEVIHRHKGLILNRAYRILGDMGEAENVASQVYIKLHSKAHLFKQGSNVTTWVYRIATNAAIDAYRKRNKSPLRCAEDLDNVMYKLGHNPENNYIRYLDTKKFLNMLSPEKRKLMVLSYNGFEYGEIADITNMPEGTVKSRLNRLRTEARTFLYHGILPSGKEFNAKTPMSR